MLICQNNIATHVSDVVSIILPKKRQRRSHRRDILTTTDSSTSFRGVLSWRGLKTPCLCCSRVSPFLGRDVIYIYIAQYEPQTHMFISHHYRSDMLLVHRCHEHTRPDESHIPMCTSLRPVERKKQPPTPSVHHTRWFLQSGRVMSRRLPCWSCALDTLAQENKGTFVP